MNKTLLTLLLFCIFLQNINGQTAASKNAVDLVTLRIPQAKSGSVKDIADYVKQNFTHDSDQVRAFYVWVTNNISYDVERFKARENDPNLKPQPVEDVLKTRAAVCQGYADLFAELCKESGIRAMVVSGYTKQRGNVSAIAHAWTAVELNGKWWLFDPTWGAGYVRDEKFVRAINENFYKRSPAEMIRDHMPFDPMYQFLDYPLTNKEFIDGVAMAAAKARFNFRDSLKLYATLTPAEKFAGEIRRIEANGVRNDLIMQRLNILKKNLSQFANKDNFTEAGNAFKNGTELFNQYLDHKNKLFTAIDEGALRQLIDSIGNYAKLARTQLNSVVAKTDAQRQALSNNYRNVEKFQKLVMQEKDFVEKYLAADKSSRKQLFIRRN